MMRLYEQGSSHRLKALGFRPNYVGGIFYEAPSLPLPNAERAPLPWTLRPADRLRQETRSQARLLRAVRTVRVEKGL